jgi:hypothetical protein
LVYSAAPVGPTSSWLPPTVCIEMVMAPGAPCPDAAAFPPGAPYWGPLAVGVLPQAAARARAPIPAASETAKRVWTEFMITALLSSPANVRAAAH